MGAADLVPGVSGGTVALITGIYDELLGTIAQLHPRMVSDLFRNGLKATWKEANAPFIAALAGGILTSVALLSKLLHHLLVNEKEALYAFFSSRTHAASFCSGMSLFIFRMQPML